MTNKTIPSTTVTATDFLASYPNKEVYEDCLSLIEIFENITGEMPVMWSTMIGFGNYHYKYPSGREGDIFRVGFSPSKVGITLYIMAGYDDQKTNLAKLGKHKIGKSCLYIKCLKDVDSEILKNIIKYGYQNVGTLYDSYHKKNSIL